MGQASTREARSSHHGEGSSSSAPTQSWPSTVDGGFLEPQGVYTGPQDYSHDAVKTAIVNRKLMPFHKGYDDETDTSHNAECPICFLYYPSPLNQTRCCSQPICTECFVQIKRADPANTKPPSSQPAECPYCTADNFGVTYTKASTPPSDAAAGSNAPPPAPHKRKSFSHTDPDVITTDMVRPDWAAKLAAANAAILRRANRRIVMRQVGDRLVPIGISSSRAGADAPEGSGPGGAIILREGERWGSFSGSNDGRRGSRRGVSEATGQDVEEMMLMEAMRLSLLEHEEQQRRQAAQNRAEGQNAQDAQISRSVAASQSDSASHAAPSSGVGIARSSSTSRGQPMAPASGRANRLSHEIRNSPAGAASTAGPALSSSVPSEALFPRQASSSSSSVPPPAPIALNFGLREDMMNELAELVEEPNDEMRSRIENARSKRETAEAEEGARQRAAAESAAGSVTTSSGPLRHTRGASAGGSGAGSPAISPRASMNLGSAPGSPPSTPNTRPLNPNNPFRSRLASSGAHGSPAPQSRSSSMQFAPNDAS